MWERLAPWAASKTAQQLGTWASRKAIRGWEAKEFGSWQIKRDIRGISFPWKVSSFWLFILFQEEIYNVWVWLYECLSLYIYVCKKSLYICKKRLYIYIYFYVYDTYFKMLFLVRNKILIPSGCNELLLSSAMKFLNRQLEAKIREANFREPSWLKEMSWHCQCMLLQLNMILQMGLNRESVAFLVQSSLNDF